jgi:phage shock protein A
MAHFSRLTDIVTCNLTEILDAAADPVQTLREILVEMDEGIAACRRTVRTSGNNHDRLAGEIHDHETQVSEWLQRAREALAARDESAARDCVARKVELEGLIAALRPEMEAAAGTRRNMLRIQQALEARSADAQRRLAVLVGTAPAVSEVPPPSMAIPVEQDTLRQQQIDEQLEQLKQQLKSC